MTYNELYSQCKEKFKLSDNIISYLFMYYLELNEVDMINNIELDKERVNSFFEIIKKIEDDYPLQYIVGNTDFYGYNFNTREGVLIPRFETEELVYFVKAYINEYFKEPISLIDVGTGSGVIGLSLKKEIPTIDVTLTDISKKALVIASENARKLNINVDIYESDMLTEVVKKSKKYDVLVSNPPYLLPDEEIMEKVKKYEPSIALYGGEDGLKYYEILLSTAKKILKEKALIAFEIGPNQATDIIKIAKKYFNEYPYEIKKDLQGRDRMFFLFYNLNV